MSDITGIAILAINPDSCDDESAYTELSGDSYILYNSQGHQPGVGEIWQKMASRATMVMVVGTTKHTKAGSAERYY